MIDRFKCYVLVMLTLANVLSVNSCIKTKTYSAPKSPPLGTLTFHTLASEVSFNVEIAEDAESRATGLMYREELRPLSGMLFMFEENGHYYFWMKNTPLSLDLIFMNEAFSIVAIIPDAAPNSLKNLDPGQDSRFVLEIAAGTAKKYGLKPGLSAKLVRK
jgi:uncharacterized membrane protein (UPF0127 family)